VFSLALPPAPGKRDLLGRALYYGQLNQAFHEFQQAYGLTVVEMCAFLYDFAPRVVEEEEDDLPTPSKAWLLVGGAGGESDFEWLEAATEASAAHWQGNINTRRGDVLLMYIVSPHKRIHSIWRALTDGFVDPFFHYHSTVWICHPTKAMPVTFAEMKAHPLLSQHAAVKTHMQGPSGRPLTVEEYDAILEIMAAKGQDISALPRPQAIPLSPSIKLDDERDVEVQLIEPLLERLGYTPDDWVRQMTIRMGRGERNYPDYVFDAKQERGEESAQMILESKFRISGGKELREAYYQAKSYALRLEAQWLVIAARDGVWVYPRHRGSFSLNHYHFYDWLGLSHPDKLHQLVGQIGKGRISQARA
jgi:hypothetical protein